MAEKPDYYKVLGLVKENKPSREEIDKAFKKLAFQNHPDRLRGKTEAEIKKAEALMAQANEAKTVLLDDEKRRTYDSYGHQGLENLAAGKSGGTGQSYTDAAGPVVAKKPLTSEGLDDFFTRRMQQREREEGPSANGGRPVTDSEGLTSEERQRRNAEARRRARFGGTTTPAPEQRPAERPVTVTPPATEQKQPRVSDEFRDTVRKTDEAVSRMGDMASVPVEVLRQFRENLQEFIDAVDLAIEKAGKPSGPKR